MGKIHDIGGEGGKRSTTRESSSHRKRKNQVKNTSFSGRARTHINGRETRKKKEEGRGGLTCYQGWKETSTSKKSE